ncbi:helix-turn-helix domain-containing protein [Chitinophaga skermanii]|nr:AraC family transcriptional regulator [Chitinophaga skermanii]
MVCPRCIKVVSTTLTALGIPVQAATLGKVTIDRTLTQQELQTVSEQLTAEGFELLDDKKMQVVEAIKNLVVETVHYGELDELKENFSTLLSQKLHKDYNTLSKLFSEQEGTTIEQYIIHQKIERVKELLLYGDLTLSEIAIKLGYSSVAHLSAQFKKVTGMTPSQFKQAGSAERKPLDAI